jgi:gliding motility-associated-like protein
MEIANIETFPAVCADLQPFQFTVDIASEPFGTWRGNGINAFGIFDPSSVVAGEHEIIYKTPGVCWVEDTMHITVLPEIILSLTGTQTYCGNADGTDILANQSGGEWIGLWKPALTYVNDSTQTFDPSVVTPGIDSIRYGIEGQCGDTATLIITIAAVDIASIEISSAGPFCAADQPAQLFLNPSTLGGVWSGGAWINATGLFDPSLAAVSPTNRVIYTTLGACPAADTFDIAVVGQIDAFLVDARVDACNGDSDIDLLGLVEATSSGTNGTWTMTPAAAGVIVGTDFIVTAAAPGDYLVKYALYGGTASCADSDSVVIRVLPVLDPTVTAGPSGDICIEDLTYQFLNTGDPLGTWSITGPGAGGVIDASTGLMDLTRSGEGTFTITYGFGGGCPIDSSTTITVVGPGDPTIQTSLELCEGGGVSDLIATGTQGGTWSGAGVDPVTMKFDPSVAGDHIITYSLGGECPIDSSVTITVLPILDPAIGNLAPHNLCISSGPHTFTSTGDAGGVWSIDGTGSINATTGEVDLVASQVGSFIVTYEFTGTCPSERTTTLTIVGPGDPTIKEIDPMCQNTDPQNLVALVTQGGTWSGAGVDPVTGEFSPETAGGGIHVITYSLTGSCPLSDNVNVEVLGLPVMDIEADLYEDCVPFTVNVTDLTPEDPITSHVSQWHVNDVPYGVTPGRVKLMSFGEPECYKVMLVNTYANGCVDTLTEEDFMCSLEVPVANFTWTPLKPTVLNPVVEFIDLSNVANTWEWDLSRGSSPTTSDLQHPVGIYGSPEEGTYDVCLKVTNGVCEDDTCVNIKIYDNFTVYVPNAFTPNRDGVNEVFYPQGKDHDNIDGAQDYRFMIFNRWGQLIWESNTPYQSWDGTDQKTNNDVQEDVYVWKLNVWDNIDGVLKSFYGHVSLIR